MAPETSYTTPAPWSMTSDRRRNVPGWWTHGWPDEPPLTPSGDFPTLRDPALADPDLREDLD
jgi:hypothetical protein